MRNSLVTAAILTSVFAFAQEKELTQAQKDSIIRANSLIFDLQEVTVTPFKQSPERQPEVKGTVLFSGKKKRGFKIICLYL